MTLPTTHHWNLCRESVWTVVGRSGFRCCGLRECVSGAVLRTTDGNSGNRVAATGRSIGIANAEKPASVRNKSVEFSLIRPQPERLGGAMSPRAVALLNKFRASSPKRGVSEFGVASSLPSCVVSIFVRSAAVTDTSNEAKPVDGNSAVESKSLSGGKICRAPGGFAVRVVLVVRATAWGGAGCGQASDELKCQFEKSYADAAAYSSRNLGADRLQFWSPRWSVAFW